MAKRSISMRRAFASLACTFAVCLAALGGERRFVHPGVTYTQCDIDRMRAMVASGREPWKSTFDKLVSSYWSNLDATVVDRGARIEECQFNGTIGVDGRRAHDLALLWRLTDDERYAKKAVEFLNANSHYTFTSPMGTAALDNGKIYLLIDAAELMRDYPGWATDDQARFKKMLTAPGCFYDRIKNFDPGRFGNQGLFAARGMIAIGIYLDNDKIYDRVVRDLQGLSHRPDDEPYPSGPLSVGEKIGFGPYQDEWRLNGGSGDKEDYGFDEQINHYIYPNGQCQEASRDQGHTIGGLHNLVAIADIAWNQGDDLFSFADNRILLGLEWNYRYNLSAVKAYPDQPQPWEPSGYTTNSVEATFENGMFLQIDHRSGRWRSLRPYDLDRGDKAGCGGTREAAFAHYAIRARLPKERYLWLERYRDYMIETCGYEGWGIAPNWFYEWTGWGTLTKRRTDWMAGDGGTWRRGSWVSGAHRIGKAVKWTDCDFYPGDGNGHTFRRKSEKCFSRGDWNAYTFVSYRACKCKIVVLYTASKEVSLAASIDKGRPVAAKLPRATEQAKASLGTIDVPAGAFVLRLAIVAPGYMLGLNGFVLKEVGD